MNLGNVLLFTGLESYAWNSTDFTAYMEWCVSHKVDTVLVKVADGTNQWLNLSTIKQYKDMFNSKGIEFIPYTYMYGDTFGMNAYAIEVDIIKSLLEAVGAACMDMEVEWNGKTELCSRLASDLSMHNGLLLCTTWADPDLQNWNNNLVELKNIIDLWLPQVYTYYLVGTLTEFNGYNVLPVIDMTTNWQNNPIATSKTLEIKGYKSICVWYSALARDNSSMFDTVVSLFKQSIPGTSEVNPNMEQQFNQVWAIGHLDNNTGIALAVKSLFMSKKISACYPITPEIDTVDWNGTPIKYQCMSNGCHAEYNEKTHVVRVYDSKGNSIV
jgi:hypothetical protein